jgi:hypothetical protein
MAVPVIERNNDANTADSDHSYPHDLTVEFSALSIYRATPPCLLTLPLELRQTIYKYVFHTDPNDRDCYHAFSMQLGDLGCRCGKGLSISNSQLYNETRARFYSCARFVFKTPNSCSNFLSRIGEHSVNVGTLAITYRDVYAQSYLLRDIFSKVKNTTNLRNLELYIDHHSMPDSLGNSPIYLPSSQKAAPAAFYDTSWRPTNHPLAELRCLRSLTVVGSPASGEVEEAIFKVRLNMETFGKKERKAVRQSEEWRAGFSEWAYTIEITD